MAVIFPAIKMMEATVVLVVTMLVVHMETWIACQKTHVGILKMMHHVHYLDVYGILINNIATLIQMPVAKIVMQ